MAIRLISGLYRGRFSGGTEEVELRVEVEDGSDTGRLSGDIFKVDGNKRAYSSSFIVSSSAPEAGPAQLTCEGPAKFSATPKGDRVRVIIPRIPAMPEPQFVTLHFRTNGTVGPAIRCDRISDFWRQIDLKQFVEGGLTPFSGYEVGGNTLDIRRAFRLAGIDVDTTGPIPLDTDTAGKVWTDAELHAAMEASLSNPADKARWRVWLLHAGRYEDNTALGMMFDQQGRERQGCAVFYNMVGGDARQQLHTCIHEIGHCFNLYHTFTASPISPRLPVRLRSRSWMNYPWNFPGGEHRYWERFQFRFDDEELVHLRHGFRNDVIMGGRPFEGNGDLRRRPGRATPELRLEGPRTVLYGEPVWVELRLSCSNGSLQDVHTCLHPREGYVKVTIRRGGGEKVIFEPLVRQCVRRRTMKDRTPYYESALLGYGKGGFYFEQPGDYEINAEYLASDGSRMVSNKLILNVSEPRDAADRAVAKLWHGYEQGMLLAFRGSDALEKGNARLDEIIRDHGDHPLASYARLVQGTNLAREFKRVGPEGKVVTRPRRLEQAQERLQPVVVDFVSGRSRINNLTFSRSFRRLAEGQVENGDRSRAAATLNELEKNLKERREILEEGTFRDHVIEAIRSQAAEILAQT